MTESVAPLTSSVPARSGDLLVKTALRNVGRNRRRTWLTVGGIGFAVFLVSVSMALQDGSYVGMRESATGLLTGHIQLVHPDYPESAKFEDSLQDVGSLVKKVRAFPGVLAASPRVQTFALASAGERSFAAQVMGVDLVEEMKIARFFETVRVGTLPKAADDAIIGTALARNLGANVGDELVLLGSGKQGGVAALAVTISGHFQTGISDIDRSVLVAPLQTVQDAFSLEGEAHIVVVQSDDPLSAMPLAAELAKAVGANVRVRPWQEIMPEVEQSIELDLVSGQFMYGIVMLLVAFSVVNTFIMVMFERTREFGMLLALGLKPWSIIGMVQIEAFGLWLLGTLAGWLLAAPLMVYLVTEGISLGDDIEQFAQQMYMPTSMYAAFTWRAALTAPLVMLIATQIAAFLPSLRLRRVNPVEALRPVS